MNEKNVPVLRFKEFKEKWKIMNLGEVTEIVMGQSPKGNSYNTEGNGVALINGPVEFTHRYPKKIKWTTSPTKYCQNRDILLCVRGSTTGRINISNDTYCIGRGVCAIRSNKQSHTPFIEYTIIYNLKKILSLSAGSTFVNLDSKSLKKFKFHLPSLPEQQKIANFLSAVDQKIQQLQEKKALLEQYKKGVLQQIFSQQIRFKQADGSDFPDWEEKRLGEVTEKFSERNKDLIDAQIYSVTNYDGFVLQTDHFDKVVAGVDLNNYKVVRKNDFAYNPARINVGSIGHFNDEIGVISSLYVCFRTNEKVLDQFLLAILELEYTKFQISRLGEGGVRIYLWYDLFALIKCKIPSIEEQKKIINFLQSIDKKIEQVQQQLEGTEEFKKGLLQQMFV